MKLLRLDAQQLTFEIEAKERQVLKRLLLLYPLVPDEHHQINRGPNPAGDRQLLNEMLAAQRKEHGEQVRQILENESWFRRRGNAYQFSLTRNKAEWLLQILNDIRVGSWIKLGSPAEMASAASRLNADNGHYFWAMEAAGYFQMILLTAAELPRTAPESE